MAKKTRSQNSHAWAPLRSPDRQLLLQSSFAKIEQ